MPFYIIACHQPHRSTCTQRAERQAPVLKTPPKEKHIKPPFYMLFIGADIEVCISLTGFSEFAQLKEI